MSFSARYFVTAISSAAWSRNFVTVTSFSARNLVTEMSSATWSSIWNIVLSTKFVKDESLAACRFYKTFYMLF